jgi:hypothetical protein
MRIRLEYLIPLPDGSYRGYGTRPESTDSRQSRTGRALDSRLPHEIVVEIPATTPSISGTNPRTECEVKPRRVKTPSGTTFILGQLWVAVFFPYRTNSVRWVGVSFGWGRS